MSTLTRPRPVAPTRPTPRPVHGRAGLILTINGMPYSVRPIRPDADSNVHRAFRLRKADGITYDIYQSHDGIAECDCPDFTFRRACIDPHGCKHIAAMRAVGMLET